MKPGDIVKVKITGEPVYLIALTSSYATVQRGKVTRNGIDYIEMQLPANSIETMEESVDREYKEVLYRHKVASSGGATNSDSSVTPFSIQ